MNVQYTPRLTVCLCLELVDVTVLNVAQWGRVAEWLGRSHRLPRAVARGVVGSSPPPLDHAALPTTGVSMTDVLTVSKAVMDEI